MRFPLREAVLLGFWAYAQAGAADFTVVRQIVGAGVTQETVVRIHDGMTRVDAGPATTILIDPKRRVMTNIMHGMRAYSEAGFDFLRAYGSAASANQPESAPPRLQKTGRQEVINGFRCLEYLATLQQPGLGEVRLQLWLTQDVEGGSQFLETMRELAAIGIGGNDATMGAGDLPGFPIRVATLLPGNQAVIATVTAVSRAPIDPALFTVPTGYRLMQQPGIPPPGPVPTP